MKDVTITGIDIPLGDLFVLLLKVAIASIPAAVVAGAIYFVLSLVFVMCASVV